MNKLAMLIGYGTALTALTGGGVTAIDIYALTTKAPDRYQDFLSTMKGAFRPAGTMVKGPLYEVLDDNGFRKFRYIGHKIVTGRKAIVLTDGVVSDPKRKVGSDKDGYDYLRQLKAALGSVGYENLWVVDMRHPPKPFDVNGVVSFGCGTRIQGRGRPRQNCVDVYASASKNGGDDGMHLTPQREWMFKLLGADKTVLKNTGGGTGPLLFLLNDTGMLFVFAPDRKDVRDAGIKRALPKPSMVRTAVIESGLAYRDSPAPDYSNEWARTP